MFVGSIAVSCDYISWLRLLSGQDLCTTVLWKGQCLTFLIGNAPVIKVTFRLFAITLPQCLFIALNSADIRLIIKYVRTLKFQKSVNLRFSFIVFKGQQFFEYLNISIMVTHVCPYSALLYMYMSAPSSDFLNCYDIA